MFPVDDRALLPWRDISERPALPWVKIGRARKGRFCPVDREGNTDIAGFDAVAGAHAAVFGQARPAATFVGISALANPALLVEIEADAILPEPGN